MTTELEALQAKRAHLEHQLARLKGSIAALYTPGITLVSPDHPIPHEVDQEIAQLEAAIVEIDAEILEASKKP